MHTYTVTYICCKLFAVVLYFCSNVYALSGLHVTKPPSRLQTQMLECFIKMRNLAEGWYQRCHEMKSLFTI